MEGITAKLFGLFILAMGVWMIQLGRKATAKAKLAPDWPTTQGKVIESEVKKRPGANAKFRFKIKYEYDVNGKRYANNTIAIGGEIRSGRISAEKRQAQYPEGSIHTVFYNPDDPTEACLEPVVEGGGRMELYGGIVGIIIGALLIAGMIG